MHGKVNKHAPGHIEDGLDVSFSVVLMMSSYPRELMRLTLILTVVNPIRTMKRIVISNILLNTNTKGITVVFKDVLG